MMNHRLSDQHYAELREWVRDYIDKKCIVRGQVMPGKRPGTFYTWMFYLRRGLFNHEFLSAISQMFVYRMDQEGINDFQLSGLETGATPMLAGIPLVARVLGRDINAFVVRKEPKAYGLRNSIEGIPNEKPVIIIDDLCNSSSSMRQCYDVLQKMRIPISSVAFSIVNKSNRHVHTVERQNTDMYLPSEIRVVSLFSLDDFNLTNPSH